MGEYNLDDFDEGFKSVMYFKCNPTHLQGNLKYFPHKMGC